MNSHCELLSWQVSPLCFSKKIGTKDSNSTKWGEGVVGKGKYYQRMQRVEQWKKRPRCDSIDAQLPGVQKRKAKGWFSGSMLRHVVPSVGSI